MEIYLINYHVEPSEKSPEHGRAEGAFATCFIKAANIREALDRAETSIAEHHWLDPQFQDAMVVLEESFEEDPDGLECFLAAEEEGEHLVFDAYPYEDEEEISS